MLAGSGVEAYVPALAGRGTAPAESPLRNIHYASEARGDRADNAGTREQPCRLQSGDAAEQPAVPILIEPIRRRCFVTARIRPHSGSPLSASRPAQRHRASLSSEHNLNLLLEKIALAAKQITHADGGILYRLSDGRRALHFEIVRTDLRNIAFGGSIAQSTSGLFPGLPMYRSDDSANDAMVAALAAITGKTFNIADAYVVRGFDFPGTRQFDARTDFRAQSFLKSR